jgi:hypothetical protein
VIDQSLLVGDFLFATHRDRALYLGKSAGDQAQWLKEHASKWRRIPNVQQDAAPLRPVAESELNIGARQYVSAQRVASMLNISVRTLSRWDAARIGPPKIKVGRLILFDVSKLTEWLANQETRPAIVAGRKPPGESNE